MTSEPLRAHSWPNDVAAEQDTDHDPMFRELFSASYFGVYTVSLRLLHHNLFSQPGTVRRLRSYD